MLTIEKTVTMSPAQMQMIVEGMRNPMNSWDKMDSYITRIEDPETLETADWQFCLEKKDEELMRNLARGYGNSHAKYRRMMTVLATINAPLYWWKEFDTYKVGTVANSCSTMHKIHAKEFIMEDFSIEHLFDISSTEFTEYVPTGFMSVLIKMLNFYREKFLETKDKQYWWQMIQLLPSSYNQKRTVMLNYQVLNDIYRDRRNHKLDEWHTFCEWIETLPYAEITIPFMGIGEDAKANG